MGLIVETLSISSASSAFVTSVRPSKVRMYEGTVGIITGTQLEAGSILAPVKKNPFPAFSISSRSVSPHGLNANPECTAFILPIDEGETARFFTTTSRMPAGDSFRHSCSCGSRRKILLSVPFGACGVL